MKAGIFPFVLSGLAAILLASTLTCCNSGTKSARGFRLPDGDEGKGKEAFVELKCYGCHKVEGVELPTPTVVGKTPVVLGGEVTRIRTYGDLVTSIINPSHRLSPRMKEEWAQASKLSPMPQFNDKMTVSQMIDLVAFLQPRYTQNEMNYEFYP
jgi:hypothetical protein